MEQNEITAELYHGTHEIEALFEIWRPIRQNSLYKIYNGSPEWHQAHINNRIENKNLVYYVLYRIKGEPVAIFPFILHRESLYSIPLSTLHICTEDYFNMLDVVVFDRTIFDYTFEYLSELATGIIPEKIDAIIFKYTSSESCVSKLLKKTENNLITYIHHNSRYVNTTSCKDFSDSITGKYKRNLRRHHSNVSRLGNLVFESVVTRDELLAAYNEFAQMESNGWKGKNNFKSTLAGNTQEYSFYKELIHILAEKNEVQINLLRLDGIILAMQIAIVAGTTLYITKITYNEKYSRYSPGNLLMHEVLKKNCENNLINRVSFITNYKWNSLWGACSDNICFNAYFLPSFKGKISCILGKSINFLRSIKRKIPANK